MWHSHQDIQTTRQTSERDTHLVTTLNSHNVNRVTFGSITTEIPQLQVQTTEA
jgi:hypothetical protein